MKSLKLILLTIFLFSINHIKASHDVGGEIYFECLGNNKFKFVAKLYRDCVNNSAGLGYQRALYTANDTFILKLDSTVDMTYQCVGPGGGGCGSTTFSGGSSMSVFSDTVTLNTPPPNNGWEFYMSGCCRPTGTVNVPVFSGFRYRCFMYPEAYYQCANSPSFLYNPSHRISKNNRSISALAHSDALQDSLYYDFQNLLNYNTGFSYSQPFPNPASTAGNLPVTINHQNGLIEFRSTWGVSGWYVYEVGVEQWRNGVLISKPVRSFHVYGNFANAHPVPSVNIDTSLFNLNQQGRVYRTVAFVGDTVSFVVSATDKFYLIDFNAWGDALSTPWSSSSPYLSKATILPEFPQTSFSNQDSSKVRFTWTVSNEHTNSLPTKHNFLLQYRNSVCPSPGVSNIMVEIEVRRSTFIEKDTLRICEGDSILLEGHTRSNSFSWTAKGSAYSSVDSTPLVAPLTSTMYYLIDPLFPGISDSVFLKVTPKDTFQLSLVNNVLVLLDSNYTTNRIWYYNQIPFNNPSDTLQPFALGDYYVQAKKGNCRLYTDTVFVTAGLFTSFFNTSNGNYLGNQQPVTGSMGITFQVNQGQNVLTTTIPGIRDVNGKTGGYDLNLKIYDSAQVEIYNVDTTLVKPIAGPVTFKTLFQLKPLRDYTLAITGDTGYVFSMIEGVNFPFTPYNNGVEVISSTEGVAFNFPSLPSNYMLPICLTYDKDIGINEIGAASFDLYPNPAESYTMVSDIEHAQSISLTNINGKEVFLFKPDPEQSDYSITRNGLPAGMYFLKIKFSDREVVRKLIWH